MISKSMMGAVIAYAVIASLVALVGCSADAPGEASASSADAGRVDASSSGATRDAASVTPDDAGLSDADDATTDAALDGATVDDAGPPLVIPTGLDIPTDKGVVHGAADGGVRSFLGIPFAVPPVGALRWTEPQPAAAWASTRDATAYGPICSQTIFPTSQISNGNGSEDCLYLNVWTPDPAPTAPVPVMVWIYGGAYSYGDGGGPYAGQTLANKGHVVVVTMNYRLGPLGFLAHSALAAEASDHLTGNYGILDQRLAMQWVQTNIGNFGGDKNAVTLFGESAGGNSTCVHLLSPGSRGLFQRAIVESGLCMKPARALADDEAIGDRFAKALGCTDPSTALTCLRAASPSQLISTANAVPQTPGGIFYQDTTTDFFFQPVVDGVIFPKQMPDAFAASEFAHVPLLHGSNGDEGIIFQGGIPGYVSLNGASDYNAALAKTFAGRASDVAQQYPLANFASPDEALAQVTGDAFFVCPARRLARAFSAAGVANSLYDFHGTLQGGVAASLLQGRAFHSAEIPYVFGNDYALGTPPSTSGPLQDAIKTYWLNFAHTGDPNDTSGSTAWPSYAVATDSRLRLDTSIDVVQGLKKGLCDFWDGVSSLAP